MLIDVIRDYQFVNSVCNPISESVLSEKIFHDSFLNSPPCVSTPLLLFFVITVFLSFGLWCIFPQIYWIQLFFISSLLYFWLDFKYEKNVFFFFLNSGCNFYPTFLGTHKSLSNEFLSFAKIKQMVYLYYFFFLHG